MATLKRACNSQKCIRAGGKHNDLDDVGKDLYHHTFFEMLGNWSFGDYFKEEAIRMAWECLTVEFQLDPDRLYVTYFGGDALKAPGVPSDEETRKIWLKYVPAERVLPFDAGDNFWEMGDTGPCGPCTEIHYDRVGGRDAAALVNMDDPDVIEIWNNVFIQYNRDKFGLKELPAQHVDTGMGFERLASILQGQMSNYDTDIFTPLFAEIQAVSGCPVAYAGKIGDEDKETKDMAYRVVADHVRTLTFAITDGAVPDTQGRGYVLRRVLRRAVWYGQHFLGAPKGFVYKLVPKLCEVLGEAFPEIVKAKDTVMAVLEGEERDFNRTIDKGARFFNKQAEKLPKGAPFPGSDAFVLSGSLGFPLDLCEIMAEERGMTVDVAGYHAALKEEQDKNAAALAKRKAARSAGADMTCAAEQTAALAAAGAPKTESEGKYVWNARPAAKVVALYVGKGGGPKGDGLVDAVDPSKHAVAGAVLDATSFYAEMGGQVYDTGALLKDDAKILDVEDVQVYGGYVVHVGAPLGPLKVGDDVACAVDYDRRVRVAPNHTMTHVLNFALREVLLGGSEGAKADAEKTGVDRCAQRGSYVDDERLRFDFAWDAPLTADQLKAVEAIVNETIAAGLVVDAVETPLDAAMAVESLRLCANQPGAVGFALLEENGIAKGVRRVVAATRAKAAAAHAAATEIRERLAMLGRHAPGGAEHIAAVGETVKALKLDVDAATMPQHEKMAAREEVQKLIAGPLKAAQKADAKKKAGAPWGPSRPWRRRAGGLSFLVVSGAGDKIAIAAACQAHVDAGLDCRAWCAAAGDAAGGGKGGGKPNGSNMVVPRARAPTRSTPGARRGSAFAAAKPRVAATRGPK
ncbi:alanyl-tRNA synthetase [Aureococcus anophagefferens]|uniref:Alanine--tRNA ligase n=1 Tax=Aureococcus anophagefferens TaxID=44056 RepID=A0ABR1G8U8_AURAN